VACWQERLEECNQGQERRRAWLRSATSAIWKLYSTYLLVPPGCPLLSGAGAVVEALLGGLVAHLLSPRPGIPMCKVFRAEVGLTVEEQRGTLRAGNWAFCIVRKVRL
jgi:hypothetical protein